MSSVPAVLQTGDSEGPIELPVKPVDSEIDKQAEQSTKNVMEKPAEEPAEEPAEKAAPVEAFLDVDKAEVEVEAEVEDTSFFKISRPTCRLASYLIRCCNFALVLASFLYSIILFMSTNKTDIYYLKIIIYIDHKPILISADIEYCPLVFQNTC